MTFDQIPLLVKVMDGFDQSIVLAIIAINMTIIGLTSLAESKKVIGVDYGQFLIKKYKIAHIVRMYYLLIAFAIVNVLSLLSILLDYQIINAINNVVLVVSLMFAIYYFFSYILIENRLVKTQIYEMELTGMYYKSDYDKHFEVDSLVNIPNGNKTSKRLSSSVAKHFDYDTEQTIDDFNKCFGLSSPVYCYSNHALKKLKSMKELADFDVDPYPYREDEYGIRDISHEFFQMLRGTELQHKWSLDILKICNRTELSDVGYNKLRLYNLTRLVAQINLFGFCETLYQYKYMEHLLNQVQLVFKEGYTGTDSLEKRHLEKVEACFFESFFVYICKTIYDFKNSYFIKMAAATLCAVINRESNKSILTPKAKMDLLVTVLLRYQSTENKQLLNTVVGLCLQKGELAVNDVENIKRFIEQHSSRIIDGGDVDLFSGINAVQ